MLANSLEARCASMKIVADKAIPYVEPFFSTLGNVDLLSEAELTAATVREADCLVVRTVTRVNEALLARSRARCVASATAGTDHIDLDCLRARGILVFDAKGCNAGAVAEYALSCLFALSADHGLELEGKIAGIIGCGNTGGRLRQLLDAIGVETRVYDPFLRDKNGSLVFQELDEVLDADIISLHVPLTTAGEHPTWRMVGRDFLKRLKTDVTFINTSRGGVVNERELLRFAERNPASRLVLDVWDNEPCINQELLAAATIATPHIAGYSLDARVNATRRVYEQARDFFGLPARPPAVSLPPREMGELRLDEFGDDMEAARIAVLAAYDARRDCAALRETMNLEPTQRGTFFSALRANYARRREFSSLRLRLPETAGALAAKLSRLGFEAQTEGPRAAS